MKEQFIQRPLSFFKKKKKKKKGRKAGEKKKSLDPQSRESQRDEVPALFYQGGKRNIDAV